MRILCLILVMALFSIEANAQPRNCHWLEYQGGSNYNVGNCGTTPQLAKSVSPSRALVHVLSRFWVLLRI